MRFGSVCFPKTGAYLVRVRATRGENVRYLALALATSFQMDNKLSLEHLVSRNAYIARQVLVTERERERETLLGNHV